MNFSTNAEQTNSLSPTKRAIHALREMQSKLDALEYANSEPIAIVGMGCRFPGGVDSPEALWRILHDGVDTITEVPKNRWNIDAYYDPDPDAIGKMYTRNGGFLNEVDTFDASFFNISPREAMSLDPQQRLLLEVSWEALENSHQVLEQLYKSPTGVFIGLFSNDYARKLSETEEVNAYFGTGNAASTAVGRLSYFMGLTGPSLAVDTACSSSLVAIHLACQSLRKQECSLALAGGVNLLLFPENSIALSQARMLSPEGRCKTFDAAADGYVRGEGCGVIVLKRLSDAITNQDNILAVIRGSAINQDGPSGGLTVPNGPSQEKVIRQALENGGVEPSLVSYIEAHGTGTSLGDPIEVEAIGTVFGDSHSRENPLMIGSLKTNMGHLEAAAGIAGLIKVVLQLRHQEIFPHLHLKEPNSYINWDELPISIPTQPIPWSVDSQKRIGGVSSFGFSGTNAHVVLEEAPELSRGERMEAGTRGRGDAESGAGERLLYLLTLSAKTEAALKESIARYQYYLEAHPELKVGDVCYSANTGRSHFQHRLAIITSDQKELANKLAKISAGEEELGVFSGSLLNNESPKIAFLFTGQGSQYINMGRVLYETQPIFRETLEKCDRLLQPYLENSILEVIYPDNTQESNNSLIDQTAYTQPALFAIEYALAKLWESWGIRPDVVMGHSVGEYVAATVAGVFSLEDGLKLIAYRGKFMQDLPTEGEMVAVMASESKVKQLIAPYTETVSIAAINGLENTVISGSVEALGTVKDILKSEVIKAKQLQVSHAFHSPLMSPMLGSFEEIANQITYHQPNIPLISNVTGIEADGSIATASYWVNHVRQPVKFAQSMETLYQEGYEVFLEVGSKPILLGMGQQCLPEDLGVWLPSLHPGQEDWQQMLQGLAKLYVQGVKVDWSGFDQDYARRKVVLPTYPFQRQRYWIETSESKSQKAEPSSVNKTTSIVDWLNDGNIQKLAQQLEQVGQFAPEQAKFLPEFLEILVKQHQEQISAATIKDWFYQVQWKPLRDTQTKTSIQPGHWLIFADTTGVGNKLAQQLQQQGCECSLVYRGDRYQKLETGSYPLNPTEPQEFELLLAAIKENSQFPLQKVIHLWSLDAPTPQDLTVTSLRQAQRWGCGTILHLVKALIKTNNTPQLWLVTRGSQSVQSTTEEVSVAASPLWGMGRAISLEHPQLWGGMVDLDPQTPESETETLWQLLTNNHQLEDHLALRGEQTYIARLVKQSLTASQPVSFKPDATYLITGGLGALGLHTANWMVEKGARHLVLISRTQPSEQKLAAISNLQQQGAEVVVAQADVCNLEELTNILEQIDSHQTLLKGIVHAAGVGAVQPIQQIDLTQLEEVMAAKVMGGWILHQLTQDQELDFFVSFSSIAAVWGGAGQAHYAASNHFLDGLTHYRRAKGLPSLSINWGPWSGGGMAGDQELKEISKRGIEPLSPEQGVAALEKLWTRDNHQTTVANVNWSLFKQLYEIGGRQLLLEEIEVEPLEIQLSHSQQQTQTTNIKQNELLERYAITGPLTADNIQRWLTDLMAKELGIETDALDPKTDFDQYGMDSIMGVGIAQIISSVLGVKISPLDLMQNPNLEKFSNFLANQAISKEREIIEI
ncbi:MAG: SDR family NAD(P)-dependent oxidoreductase [Symploca sp. SIO2D2]|nr:SDR family NAD(P)-dependent oxidoreductase [Symploca sp. SIO2D2]